MFAQPPKNKPPTPPPFNHHVNRGRTIRGRGNRGHGVHPYRGRGGQGQRPFNARSGQGQRPVSGTDNAHHHYYYPGTEISQTYYSTLHKLIMHVMQRSLVY